MGQPVSRCKSTLCTMRMMRIARNGPNHDRKWFLNIKHLEPQKFIEQGFLIPGFPTVVDQAIFLSGMMGGGDRPPKKRRTVKYVLVDVSYGYKTEEKRDEDFRFLHNDGCWRCGNIDKCDKGDIRAERIKLPEEQ